MPDFTLVQARLDSTHRATALLEQLKNIYRQCKAVEGSINLYTSGTDPTFNQAINNIFTASERAELNQMLSQVETLVANWETNHEVLLEINP